MTETDDNDIDIEELMQEPPGGHNHGRTAWQGGSDDFDGDSKRELSTEAMIQSDFLKGHEGHGWQVVLPRTGGAQGGTVAHRGVLHPAEYVDHERLVRLVGQTVGVSYDELRETFISRGRPSAEKAKRRAEILAKLRDALGDDGNVSLLAQILGIERTVITRALRNERSGS